MFCSLTRLADTKFRRQMHTEYAAVRVVVRILYDKASNSRYCKSRQQIVFFAVHRPVRLSRAQNTDHLGAVAAAITRNVRYFHEVRDVQRP